MCNCNAQNLEVMKGHILKQLPEHTEFDANWSHGVFRLDGKSGDVMMNMKYEYRKVKTNGTPAKNMSRSDINLTMKYCPFCGVEYNPKVA